MVVSYALGRSLRSIYCNIRTMATTRRAFQSVICDFADHDRQFSFTSMVRGLKRSSDRFLYHQPSQGYHSLFWGKAEHSGGASELHLRTAPELAIFSTELQ
jgi:hypothetical protein